MNERAFEEARAAGPGGIGYFLDAVARWQTVTRTVARLRVSGPDRYRVEYSSRPDGRTPVITACDGDRRWRVVQDRIVVGPAAPLRDHGAFLADSCWLLHGRLSGGQEITYRGRPARQLRVTPVPGREEMVLGPLMFFPADAIVDAETGCLLRLISYAGDTLALWWELDDISTEPADPDEFQVHVPPGTRTVEETGNLIADTFATMPGLTGTAVRAATETVNRTTAAVSAARSIAAPHITTSQPAQDLVPSRERWCNARQLCLRRCRRAARAPSAHRPISVRPGVAQRRSRPVELTQPVQSGPADSGDSAAQCPAHQLAALVRIQPVRSIEQAMQQRVTMTRRHAIGTREQLLKPRRIVPQCPGSGPPAQRRLHPALVARYRLITDLHRPCRAISGAEIQPLRGYPGEREHDNDLVAEQRLGQLV